MSSRTTLLGVNSQINRRHLLLGSLALASTARGAKPDFAFPTDISHRLSVSTYPFRSVIGKTGSAEPSGTKPRMDLAEFAGTVVRDFGVYGIEPWSHHFDSIEPEYIAGLRKAFQSAGLQVVNIPCDVNVQPCGTDQQRAQAQVTWRKWVDAAKALGSPSIRVHVPAGSANEDIGCAVEALKAIAAYGESNGTVINLENDDPASEDPYRVVKVIKAVNSPYLRSLPDFCNSMQIRNDKAENLRALKMLFPLAWNISHVKDVEVVDGKEFRVDVGPIFAAAKQAGYRGYFSMETEGSLDPYVGTRQLIAASRKGLAAFSD